MTQTSGPDALRSRIAHLQHDHMPIDYAGGIECACGETCKPEHGGIDVAEQMWAVHVADAVLAELDYEERVTSAIQGYAQSEMVGLSYHDPLCRETAYAAMQRLNAEASQIARYSTTYLKADDD